MMSRGNSSLVGVPRARRLVHILAGALTVGMTITGSVFIFPVDDRITRSRGLCELSVAARDAAR